MRLKRRLLALYSAVLLLLCPIAYGVTDNVIQTAMVWFWVFSCWVIGYQIFYCWSKEERLGYLKKSQNIYQVQVILLLISFWGFSAFACKSSEQKLSLEKLFPWFGVWICTIVLLVRCVFSDCLSKESVKRSLGSHKCGIGLLFISLAIRVPMLSTLQRWDAGEYYSRLIDACENYDFTMKSVLDYFRLCGHTNLGFSLPLAIGEFWNPAGMTGALIVNLILTLVAIYVIYLLIKDCWLKCSDFMAAGLALAISFTPLFLGTSSYLNTDYLLAIWFIILLYTDYKKWYIFSWFFAVLLSQSKETGIVVLVGYYGLRFLYEFICERKKILQIPAFWLLLTTGCVYAYVVFQIGSLTTWSLFQSGETIVTWNLLYLLILVAICIGLIAALYGVRRLYYVRRNWFRGMVLLFVLVILGAMIGFLCVHGETEEFNCFGISTEYILFKLKQYFVLNFSWLISLCAVVAFGRMCYLKIRYGKEYSYQRFISCAGGILAFLLFGFFYLVSGLTRYNIILSICWSAIGILGLYSVMELKKYRVLHLLYICFWTVLFGIQSFWNIDPVSGKIFDKLAIDENSTMLYVGYEPDYYSPYYGDSLITNYQYAWIDRAIDQFLKEIDYQKDMQILLPRKESFGLFINGNGDAYSLRWNTQLKKRVYNREDPNAVTISVLSQDDFLGTLPRKIVKDAEYAAELPDELYIPVLAYYEPDLESLFDVLDYYYYVTKVNDIKSYGGKLTYYHAVRKEVFYDYQLDELLRIGGEESMLEDYGQLSTDVLEEVCNQIKEKEENFIGKEIAYNGKILKNISSNKTVIQKGDLIQANMFICTEDGEYLDENYTGSLNSRTARILLGYNRYLDELEQALIGVKLNETIVVKCQIPENYVPAGAYAGETLTFYITPTKLLKRISRSDIKDIDPSKYISEEWINEQLSIAAGELALQYDYNSFGFSDGDFDTAHDEVKLEIEEYCALLGIDELEYVENYLGITYDDYGVFINRIAMTVLKKAEIQERLLNYYEKRIKY